MVTHQLAAILIEENILVAVNKRVVERLECLCLAQRRVAGLCIVDVALLHDPDRVVPFAPHPRRRALPTLGQLIEHIIVLDVVLVHRQVAVCHVTRESVHTFTLRSLADAPLINVARPLSVASHGQARRLGCVMSENVAFPRTQRVVPGHGPSGGGRADRTGRRSQSVEVDLLRQALRTSPPGRPLE